MDDWERYYCYFWCFFFLQGLKKNPLNLYVLLWFCMWERSVVSLRNWTRFFGPHHPLVLHHTTDRCGHICSTRRSAGTTGHGPFHCITPFLTSLVHMAAVFVVIETLGPTLPLLYSPFAATHIRFYWLNHTTSIECVYLYELLMCTEGPSHINTVRVRVCFLKGAIWNFLFNSKLVG